MNSAHLALSVVNKSLESPKGFSVLAFNEELDVLDDILLSQLATKVSGLISEREMCVAQEGRELLQQYAYKCLSTAVTCAGVVTLVGAFGSHATEQRENSPQNRMSFHLLTTVDYLAAFVLFAQVSRWAPKLLLPGIALQRKGRELRALKQEAQQAILDMQQRNSARVSEV